MQLSYQDQMDLRHAAHYGLDTINATIKRLRSEKPHAFQDAESLAGRVFYHEPMDSTIPHHCAIVLRSRRFLPS